MNRLIAIMAAVIGIWFLLIPNSIEAAGAGFIFTAILLRFAYSRLRASPTTTALYQRYQEGDWLRIEVCPAAAPLNWFAAIGSLMFGAFTVGSTTPFLWVMGYLFAAILGAVLLLDPRGKGAGHRTDFRVGVAGIELKGKLLGKADIHSIRIKNPYGGEIEIHYDASQGLSMGTLVGMAHRRKVSETAFQIQVEVAGKAHLLAAGLDEVTARGIVADIGQAMHPQTVQ